MKRNAAPKFPYPPSHPLRYPPGPCHRVAYHLHSSIKYSGLATRFIKTEQLRNSDFQAIMNTLS